MLDIIRSLFGSDDQPGQLVIEANEVFLGVLDQAADLLSELSPTLLAPDAPESLQVTARSVDKASNKSERTIRKLLIEALAFDRSDGPFCLVLMSVAKDAERMVDECRNLAEIGQLLSEPVPDHFAERIRSLAADLAALLRRTRACFADNDEHLAVELVESEKAFIAAINADQDALLADQALTTRQAVVLSRSLRFLQRIRAHLGNIASTVIFPVHQIDFAKRKFLAEVKERLGIEDDNTAEPKDQDQDDEPVS